MPILRYFVFVGGALLALLFVSDAVLPQVPLPAALRSGSDVPMVRIRSERKWPERIVMDTSVPPISTVAVATADAAPPMAAVADVQAKSKLREAFAQMGNAEPKSQLPMAQVSKTAQPAVARSVEAKIQPKRRVAKVRSSRPMILVAQQPQPHAGWFESTW